MMKLRVVLAFLLFVPLVAATINIDGPPRSTYNYGVVVVYSGYAGMDSDFSGTMQLKVVCDNSTEFPYQLVPLTLMRGQNKIFPGDIQPPRIVLSPFMVGDCVIVASILQMGSVLESTASNPFNVGPDVTGSF